MKITDECRNQLNELLSKNGADTLIIKTTDSTEKGFIMNLDLGKKENNSRVIQVNGINVAISEEDEDDLEDIVFDFDGEQIVIEQEHHCCSCQEDCCGCHEQDGTECSCHCHE